MQAGGNDGPTGSGRASAAPVDRFATVNGLRTHYLEWGGPGSQPLLLLHGIGRVAHTFDHAAPHFSARHRVIAVDMRGHGDSGWDPQAAYPSDEDLPGFLAVVDRFLARH